MVDVQLDSKYASVSDIIDFHSAKIFFKLAEYIKHACEICSKFSKYRSPGVFLNPLQSSFAFQ